MIKSFKNKGLKKLFETGSSSKIGKQYKARALRRLDALDQAESLTDLDLPGFDFHALRGKPQRYTIHVNGPWCITFEWDEATRSAEKVDFEQYH